MTLRRSESGNMKTINLKGVKSLGKAPKYLENANIRGDDMVMEFDSLSQYKRFMIDNRNFDKCDKLSSMKRNEWSGSYTYDDFITVLDDGDENVMKKMKIATDKEVAILEKKYEEKLNGYKFDVTGQFFDVGLVLTGVPEVWLEPEYEPEEKVQVELVIDGAFSANFSKDKIVKAASRILSIAKVLDEKGVEVKIRIVSGNERYTRKDKGIMYMSTLIKDYDEPINYKKVSTLLSPTYHRRGTFKMIEMIAGQKIGDGYGCPKQTRDFIQLDDARAIDRLEKKLFS